MTGSKYKYILIIFSLSIIAFAHIFILPYFKRHELDAVENERKSILKYATQCYATEGFYPPNIDYLVDNYNLLLKKDKYIYFYDAFSSNIRPDVIVTKKPVNMGTTTRPLDLE